MGLKCDIHRRSGWERVSHLNGGRVAIGHEGSRMYSLVQGFGFYFE